jgi:hypothetical protein
VSAQNQKTKNPARVDAAVHQHLRRMNRSLRTAAIVCVVASILFVTLVSVRPAGSRRVVKLISLGAVISFLVAGSAGLGILSLRARRKATRAKLLRTCQCGYDLRATDDNCPECGTPISDALRRAREAGLDRQYIGQKAGIEQRPATRFSLAETNSSSPPRLAGKD